MTQIPISEAKAQLTDLVRRAEDGETVILTRHGQDVIRLTPVRISPQLKAKRLAAIRSAQAAVAGQLPADFDAARSQDFLYDEDGLPA
ncbi:MAG: type II toxin-antitoxin system prevent-host-death family antitoxin [Brevundimonas sp.]|uniref:type II toxin-antitoxin system Phd/YefM family antitoxin n=1 Tax=Brevundimonas sp. TaxID=1871086 RepID=UPI002736595B|nr:type II toxin-antitoxin system prevent-host-death family antitoxin [Brevundimonas sp.]MDP3404679.1 type II toxin-antitoxin system prevent-host-death family antitoxin [Brevundimonas sp.]